MLVQNDPVCPQRWLLGWSFHKCLPCAFAANNLGLIQFLIALACTICPLLLYHVTVAETLPRSAQKNSYVRNWNLLEIQKISHFLLLGLLEGTVSWAYLQAQYKFDTIQLLYFLQHIVYRPCYSCGWRWSQSSSGGLFFNFSNSFPKCCFSQTSG